METYKHLSSIAHNSAEPSDCCLICSLYGFVSLCICWPLIMPTAGETKTTVPCQDCKHLFFYYTLVHTVAPCRKESGTKREQLRNFSSPYSPSCALQEIIAAEAWRLPIYVVNVLPHDCFVFTGFWKTLGCRWCASAAPLIPNGLKLYPPAVHLLVGGAQPRRN